MDRRTIGMYTLSAALLMGVICDALLRTDSWGLNVLVCNFALIIVAGVLGIRFKLPLGLKGRWLAAGIILLSSGMALRDSPTLKGVACLGLFICYSLALLSRVPIRAAGVFHYAEAGFTTFLNAVLGSFPLLLTDLKSSGEARKPWITNAKAATRSDRASPLHNGFYGLAGGRFHMVCGNGSYGPKTALCFWGPGYRLRSHRCPFRAEP